MDTVVPMICVARWLLALAVLLGSLAPGSGATAEDRRFEAAVKKLQLGGPWEVATHDLAAFVTNFPSSFRVPEAIFYRAEAAITNSMYPVGIELLQSNLSRAMEWEDKYLLWIGVAQIRSGDNPAAAKTFANLLERFPGSSNRLEACLGEATAYAKQDQWRRVLDVLQQSGSPFLQAVGTVTNESIVPGHLLLAEARLAADDFEGARNALAALDGFRLRPDHAWRRAHVQSRLELAAGRLEEAYRSGTNLVSLATAANNPNFRAESLAFQARVLERSNQLDAAVGVYQMLATNAPVKQQRLAILKTVEIQFSQNKIEDAARTAELFWANYSNAPAADMALLALGELRLKRAVMLGATNAPGSNWLAQALGDFELLRNRFPDSTELGRSWLDTGWCLWLGGRYAAAAEAFSTAADRLDSPADKAVARFKLGDALFKANDFAGAVSNYALVSTQFATVPEVKERFLEQALYQELHAAVAGTNMMAAELALRRLLEWYPNGFAADDCLLLLGDAYSRGDNPTAARATFDEFERRFPTNDLIPEVRLAVARSYENEGLWAAAATNYAAWTSEFTKHPQLPQAAFSEAWATAKAGREPEALNLFTNFVAQWPTNQLTPQARLWIANYYFNTRDFQNAEASYQYVISTNGLGFEAQMMAGRAAVARLSYRDAISYFSKLVNAPACPVHLKVQAAFAIGDAYFSVGTTNRQEALKSALESFQKIPALDAASAQVPAALVRMGDCYKELGVFDDQNYAQAVQSYNQAITHSNASVTVRNEAKIGMGIVAEKRAETRTGDERAALRREALSQYYDVFVYESGIRDGEKPDPAWIKEAGIKAGRLAEQMQQWETAERIYRRLQELFPTFASSWDARILSVRQAINRHGE